MSNTENNQEIDTEEKYKNVYLDMFALFFVWNTSLDIQKSIENFIHVKDEIIKKIDTLNEPDNVTIFQIGYPFPDDEALTERFKTKVIDLFTNTFVFNLDKINLEEFYIKKTDILETGLRETDLLNIIKRPFSNGYTEWDDYPIIDPKKFTPIMYLKLQHSFRKDDNMRQYIELANKIIKTGKANLEYVLPRVPYPNYYDRNTYLLHLLTYRKLAKNLGYFFLDMEPLIIYIIQTRTSNPGHVNNRYQTALILACESKDSINIMDNLLDVYDSNPYYISPKNTSLFRCLDKKYDKKFDNIKNKLRSRLVAEKKNLPEDIQKEIYEFLKNSTKSKPKRGGRTRRKRNNSCKQKRNNSCKQKRNKSCKQKRNKSCKQINK
jgi:hypothetical protein